MVEGFIKLLVKTDLKDVSRKLCGFQQKANQVKQAGLSVSDKVYSQIFKDIHRKTPVLESLFDKVAGLETNTL